MTVEWQFLPVQMQGMDTKTDDKNLPTGKFTLLQNVVMRKTGKLEKRFGTSGVSIPLNTAHSIFDFDGSRYTMYQSKVAIGGNTFVNTNSSMLGVSESKQLISTDEVGSVAVGVSQGQSTSAAVWKKIGNNAIYWQLINTASQSPTTSAITFVTASAVSDFCCFDQTSRDPLAVVSGAFGVEIWQFTSTTASRLMVVSGLIIATGTRAFANGNNLYISYVTSGGDLIVSLVNLNTLVVTRSTTVLTGTSLNFSDVYVNQNAKVFVAGWSSSAGNCLAAAYRYSADLLTQEANLVSGSLGPVANASDVAITTRGASNGWMAFHHVNPAGSPDYTYVTTESLAIYGLHGIKPASRGWSLLRDDAIYHPHCFFQATNTESSLFLLSFVNDFLSSPVLTTLFGRALNPIPAYKSQVTAAAMRFAFAESIFGYVEGGVTGVTAGIRHTALTLEVKGQFAYPPRGCCHDVCSSLKFFDGSYEYTPAPAHVPRAPTLNNAGGGSIPAGTYLYCVVVEWPDSIGNIIRSSPSIASTITLGGPSKVDVLCYSTIALAYYHYASNGQESGARAVVYRTEAAGSVFYRVGSVRIDYNNPTYIFQDNLAVGATSTPLYTTGGALENIIPAPFRAISSGVSRIFGLSWEADELWFSKRFVAGEIPGFNESLRAQLDRVGGAPVAVLEMDDKIVVFKQRAIQVFFGDGPDETGAGNFQGPQTVNSEIGCTNKRACVLTDEGIIFQSAQGFWLLNRGLQCTFIGADVEDYKDLTITGCFNLSDRNFTYFYSLTGTTLVYDSYHKIWSVFTGQPSRSVAAISGVPTYLNSASTFVISEGTVAGTENGTNYDIRITTGWISLAGLQGFQRIRRLAFLGRNYAVNTAAVNISYDFINTVEDTYTIDSAVVTTTGKYQYQLRLNRQKCESIKIDLQMSSANQGFDLSGIAIEAGLKPKTARMSPTARIAGV